eukprot:14962-Pelagococcus_subviridis.AAC.2
MTYRCAGGLGAPAQSSYAMTPLEPARTRRREEEGGALVQRREGRRGRGMEGERARRDATRRATAGSRDDSIRFRGRARTDARGRADDAAREAVLGTRRLAHRAVNV